MYYMHAQIYMQALYNEKQKIKSGLKSIDRGTTAVNIVYLLSSQPSYLVFYVLGLIGSDTVNLFVLYLGSGMWCWK